MKVYSDIDGLTFAAMKGLMLHEATEHGLPVLDNSADSLRIQSEYGVFGIVDRGSNAIRIEVEADGPSNLHVLREGLVDHIIHFLPDLTQQIAWSDTVQEGLRPPNFQFAEVIAAERLCPSFQRLTLCLSKPEGFNDRAIHFRFVLPHQGNTDPEWPTLTANGSTRWPTGDKALHRPVYTLRAQRGAEIDVDVFVHEGGQASDWAIQVRPGTQVAVIGPGGGGVIDASDVVLAGDETAYPAISRIIESLADDVSGRVILLNHDMRKDYPLPQHPGLSVQTVGPDAFVTAVCAAASACTDGYVWIAAEAEQVKLLRKANAIEKHPKSARYLATYWTRVASESD
ncbi:siderophore-interacting protein [Tateyamaria sp. syn59]|uniref:siderophore-interacting protein n=1 Tax=Tateyamaria sp. syn59 TaxID=2576942 RepID=UPI0011BFC58C|nr:siderophore-interacting protein [Tateyamaria sp. syn59]